MNEVLQNRLLLLIEPEFSGNERELEGRGGLNLLKLFRQESLPKPFVKRFFVKIFGFFRWNERPIVLTPDQVSQILLESNIALTTQEASTLTEKLTSGRIYRGKVAVWSPLGRGGWDAEGFFRLEVEKNSHGESLLRVEFSHE